MPNARGPQGNKPRKRCRLCNNLDPRDHKATTYDGNIASGSSPGAHLILAIDAYRLSRVEEGGCRFCLLLKQVLDGLATREWRQKQKPIALCIAEKGPIILEMYKSDRESIAVEIYSPSGRLPWPTLGSALEIPSHGGSDDSVDFIKRRVDDCASSDRHKLCQESRSDLLPARLLDVFDEEGHIRLCESNTEMAKYMALSHCWGSGPCLTTKQGNLAIFQDEITWDSLPVLFQDAVKMTRSLGVRYLWIDSLCIVQDSHSDWETQSAQMSSIFENAHLVLSATGCTDSDQGFLLPRKSKLKLQYRNTTGKQFEVHARPFLDHHPNLRDQMPSNPTGPLMTRAWAMQEQAICTRIVHFTPTEVIYECRTAVCCECRPTPKNYPTTPGLLAKALLSRNSARKYQTWHQVVNQYTLRNITHLADRLPALSGLAEKFEKSIGSSYLAGLWRSNLAADLLWSSSPNLQHPHLATRIDVYRAPSFCWSSVETQVQYERADEEIESTSLIKILDTEIACSMLSPLGEVTNGWLSLRGAVMDGVLIAPECYTFHYRLKIRGILGLNVYPDSLLVEDKLDSRYDGKQRTVRRARTEEVYGPFTIPVTCLAITTSSDHCIVGIVLALSTRVLGAFERLGLFTCGHEGFQDARKKNIKIV